MRCASCHLHTTTSPWVPNRNALVLTCASPCRPLHIPSLLASTQPFRLRRRPTSLLRSHIKWGGPMEKHAWLSIVSMVLRDHQHSDRTARLHRLLDVATCLRRHDSLSTRGTTTNGITQSSIRHLHCIGFRHLPETAVGSLEAEHEQEPESRAHHDVECVVPVNPSSEHPV